jgi:ribosomal protein L6P/L9E
MRYGFLVGLFLAVFSAAWALNPDATREQVIAELGKPTSVAKMGKREIMIYPGGVRLELEEGKVVAAKGIVLNDALAVEKTTINKDQKPQATENRAIDGEFAQPSAMDKVVEGLEKSHDEGQHPVAPKKFSIVGFVLGMILKFLLTVAALILASKYWGAEVFLSVIFTVAGVDALISGLMNLIGELVLGFPTLLSADDLVGGIVMLFLVKKLSINHSIGQAVQLTLTTKTFIVVVGSFLITMVVRLVG